MASTLAPSPSSPSGKARMLRRRKHGTPGSKGPAGLLKCSWPAVRSAPNRDRRSGRYRWFSRKGKQNRCIRSPTPRTATGLQPVGKLPCKTTLATGPSCRASVCSRARIAFPGLGQSIETLRKQAIADERSVGQPVAAVWLDRTCIAVFFGPISAKGRVINRHNMAVAFVFPGQGSQTVGMGKALAANFATARLVFEEVDTALGSKLSATIFEGPAEALTLTENAQPALMAVSLAVVRVLEAEAGLDLARDATFVAGHSLGEYSALAAAGAVAVADAARLLRTRGQAMQKAVPVGPARWRRSLVWNSVPQVRSRLRRHRVKSAKRRTITARAKSSFPATRALSNARWKSPNQTAPNVQCCCRSPRPSTAL